MFLFLGDMICIINSRFLIRIFDDKSSRYVGDIIRYQLQQTWIKVSNLSWCCWTRHKHSKGGKLPSQIFRMKTYSNCSNVLLASRWKKFNYIYSRSSKNTHKKVHKQENNKLNSHSRLKKKSLWIHHFQFLFYWIFL